MRSRGWMVVAAAGWLACAGALYAETAKDSRDTLLDALGSAQIELDIDAAKISTQEDIEANVTSARLHSAQVAAVLASVARDPQRFNAYIAHTVMGYALKQRRVSTAPQACQVAAEETFRLALVQAQQNQRIIELLEQSTKKPAQQP